MIDDLAIPSVSHEDVDIDEEHEEQASLVKSIVWAFS